MFAACDLDPRREQAARQLWDGAALNASCEATCQKLVKWMQGADQLELDVAARESFLLGSEAIRQLVFDPLPPKPLVDVSAWRALTEVARACDQMAPTALTNAVLWSVPALSGHAWLYGVRVPAYLSALPLFMRIRSIAEHACLTRTADVRPNTRTTRAGF